MEKKVVLITGCANGIGRHLSEIFYQKGYSVVATDIDFEKLKLEKKHWILAQNVQNTEGSLLEKLDVTKADEWQNLMKKITDTFGRLDICVNNAGVVIPSFVSDLTTQNIDSQVDVNVKGIIYGTKNAAEIMLKQGSGHIINFASLAGVAPIHGLSVYSATKFAVRGFSLSIVPEMQAKSIHVSVICPDLVDTNMLTSQLDYSAAAMSFSGKKYLKVEDIEHAVFEHALKRKKIEILVPYSRGLLAKIGNFFPKFGFLLTNILARKGLKMMTEIKNQRQE